MTQIVELASIRQDLVDTATDLEQIASALRGHAEFLSRSVHHQDIDLMESRMRELHSSASALRDVASHIPLKQTLDIPSS